jgi:hypothetical protein
MEEDDPFASDGEYYYKKEEADGKEETESSDTNPQDSHTEEPTLEDITSDVINMSVVKPKDEFSMDIQFPFMMYDYDSDDCHRVSVDFLIMPVSKDMVRPKMAANGLELHVGVVVPSFFADADRPGFIKDTHHKAMAFKEAATKFHEHHRPFDKEEIMGAPQRIKLPFKC